MRVSREKLASLTGRPIAQKPAPVIEMPKAMEERLAKMERLLLSDRLASKFEADIVKPMTQALAPTPAEIDYSPILARLDRLEAALIALSAPEPEEPPATYKFTINRGKDGKIIDVIATPNTPEFEDVN